MSSTGTATSDEEERERHLMLAGVVKGVHAKLRKQYKINGDFDQIWKDHCKDHEVLSQYANAMHSLARDHWSKHPETRIDWCRATCIEYFLKDGLKKSLEKDDRRKKYETLRKSGEGSTLEVPDGGRPSEHLVMSQRTSIEEPSNGFDNKSFVVPDIINKDLLCLPEMKDATDSSIGPLGEVGTNQAHAESCNVTESDDHDLTHFAVSTFDLRETGGSSGCPSEIESQKPEAKCQTFLEKQQFGDGTEGDVEGSDDTESLRGGTEDFHSLQDVDREAVYAKYGKANYNTINVPLKGKIRLLDVGSCFNPFIEFKEFLAIGIDISPAVESVYYCDFLHLELSEPLQLAGDTVDTVLHNLKGPVERLPSSAFHVVVFSLLLEYFPSAYQRWVCCLKAHQLLALNGLLLIITPDSHQVNRNAPMMKSWKSAIESLGFKRWKYIKQEHLHCMAFRKITLAEATDNLLTDISPDMLYIPQDHHSLEEDDSADYFFASMSRTDDEDAVLRDTFGELPELED